MPALYRVIRPQYVFCPQSKQRAESGPMQAYKTLKSLWPRPQFFFANLGIVYGLTPAADGRWIISETPVTCIAYDGSYNC